MMRLAAGVAAAKAVGTLARTAGRGGGTSLPGKVLTRVEPHAIGRLASRLDRGSVVISATNGKTTTAAMVASILERTGARLVHNRAGANMAGGIASALADASRKGGRALTGDFGLFEVDEFWLGPVVEELEPRAMLLGNLFRDQLDRYGELETIADRWAAVVARRPAARRSCSTPTTRSWPTSGGCTRRAVGRDRTGRPGRRRDRAQRGLLRRRRRLARAARAPARLGLQALPPLRPRLRLQRRLPRPPRPLPLPELRPGAPDADRRRPPTSSCAASAAPRSRCAAARVELPLPGLYNVYNALGAAALTLSARRRARRRRRRACRPSRPRSAAPRRSTSAAARPRSCWSRTRPAPTRCCATLALEDERARPARRPQRPHRRRPRRLLGLGRRLGAARRPRAPLHLLAARAPPSSRCG